jgi:hypothetical protein
VIPRRFELGEFVWVGLGQAVNRYGRIVGYEEGKYLKRMNFCEGWVYHVRMAGDGGKSEWVVMREDQLRAVSQMEQRG